MQGEKELWELVVDKAREWLDGRNLEPGAEGDVDRFLKEVKG